MTPSAAAGVPTVCAPGPALPAEATTTAPARFAAVAARPSGSVPSPSPPKLMLITSALCGLAGSTAASSPAIMSDSVPPPNLPYRDVVDLVAVPRASRYGVRDQAGRHRCAAGAAVALRMASTMAGALSRPVAARQLRGDRHEAERCNARLSAGAILKGLVCAGTGI